MNEMALKGISGVCKVFMRQLGRKNKIDNEGRYDTKSSEWVLDTELLSVLAVLEFDNQITLSKKIVEIYKVLGGEAARNVLLREIQ
jgi:hypothetical protein